MRRYFVLLSLFCLNASGILFAQKGAADPSQRYFRLICLVHLTGSGKPGDPILPEYVARGTATAQAALAAAVSASSNTGTSPGAATQTAANIAAPRVATAPGTSAAPVPVSAAAPPVPRPGFLAWSMQTSDDGTMAIVHIVAADPSAFAPILADKRPEIRVFQIGKDSPAAIQAAMQLYRKDFNLNTFEVVVQ